MKAISLWQPYASALFIPGLKTVETRSWSTTYRGPLLIHATKHTGREAREFRQRETQIRRVPAELPEGALIGIVDLVDVQPAEKWANELGYIERLYGDFSAGRFAWILTAQRRFVNPIEFKGAQGFFEVPDELISQQQVDMPV